MTAFPLQPRRKPSGPKKPDSGRQDASLAVPSLVLWSFADRSRARSALPPTAAKDVGHCGSSDPAGVSGRPGCPSARASPRKARPGLVKELYYRVGRSADPTSSDVVQAGLAGRASQTDHRIQHSRIEIEPKGEQVSYELSESQSTGLGTLRTLGTEVPLEGGVTVEATHHGDSMRGDRDLCR